MPAGRQVQQLHYVGGSVAVVIPKPILRQINARRGDPVMLTVISRSVLITPLEDVIAERVREEMEAARRTPPAPIKSLT